MRKEKLPSEITHRPELQKWRCRGCEEGGGRAISTVAASLAHSNMRERLCKNEKLAVMGCAPPGFLEQCLGLLLPDPPKSAASGPGLAGGKRAGV